jgi:hypothetical protein
VLGARSFEKGWKTGTLGLLLHFLIAFSAAAVFSSAAGLMPGLLRFPALAGAAYGIIVFVVMNLLVLPLSAMRKRSVTTGLIVTQLIIHVLFVGLPIALTAKWARC